MAKIALTYTFNDGDIFGAEVELENDYPDALNQAKNQVEALFAVGLSCSLNIARRLEYEGEDADDSDAQDT